MQDHINRFARYNQWANTRLFTAVSDLSDEAYREDCGAFFGSLHGTLNHLLLGDRIWYARFTGSTYRPDGLDVILYHDFEGLRQARHTMDTDILAYCAGLDDLSLQGTFNYLPITTSDHVTMRLDIALCHFFNHQTHHRGQAHAMLSRLVGEAPSLDLIYFHLEEEAKAQQ